MKQRYQAFSYIIIAFVLQQIKTTYATDNGNGNNNVNYGTDPLLQLEVDNNGNTLNNNNNNKNKNGNKNKIDDNSSATKLLKKNYYDNIELIPQVISTQPRVTYYENFLTDDECEYFKNKAPELEDWDDTRSYTSVYFKDSAFYNNEMVNKIEWRIAGITGIMPHYDQEALCIHKIKPEPDINKKRLDNIHHDKANKPWTTVTVLMYLADTELGGETIFPCNLNQSTSNLCRRSFNGRARWHNGKRTVVEGVIHYTGENNNGKKSKVEKEMKKLRDITSDLCAETYTSLKDNNNDDMNTEQLAESVSQNVEYLSSVTKHGQGALKVKPKKGSAIMFWHDNVGFSGLGVGDPLAWHTGCHPYTGTKWTMQKFSEVPMSTRREIHAKEQQTLQQSRQKQQRRKKKRKHRNKKH